MSIVVTEKAVKQVNSLMKDQELVDHHLRIGVSGGGCSGLEYYLAFDSDIDDADEVNEFNGLKVVVDHMSVPYLDGATLDYSTDLMNSGFVFSNPNATRTCGCGKSFCG